MQKDCNGPNGVAQVHTHCCKFFLIFSSSDDDCWREVPEEEAAVAGAPVAAMACAMACANMSEVMAGLEGVGREEELAEDEVDGAMKAVDGPAPPPPPEADAGAIPVKDF